MVWAGIVGKCRCQTPRLGITFNKRLELGESRAKFRLHAVSEIFHPISTPRTRFVECTLQVIDMPSPMLQGWQLTSSICRTLTLCRRPAADFISDAFSSCD